MATNYTSLVTAKTPAVPGHVNYGIPVEYIPRLYAIKVLIKYYASTVLTAITNNDYEGQIKEMGDTVVIRTRPDVTISNYAKGQKLNFEQLSSPSLQLNIDRGKSYSFEIDDIDSKQVDIALNENFMADAAEQMAIVVDRDVLSSIVLDIDSLNQGIVAGAITGNINLGSVAVPLVLTKTNILDTIVDCKVVLTEQNVPLTGRWMVLPANIAGLVDKSDLNQVQVSGDEKTRLYQKGWIGSLAGFDIFDSNLLDTFDDSGDVVFNIPFGHRDAVTFAAQLVKNKSVELIETFGRGYKGLQVYGFLVQKPNALGLLRAKV